MSHDPAPRSPRPLRQLGVRRTPARDAATRYLAQAVAGRWTARQLADKAGCDIAVACDVLAKASEQIHKESQQAISIETGKLAQEARKARNSAIARLESLGQAVDSVAIALQAKGSTANAKDVKEAVAAASQLWKHVESLTGLDVAKVAATRQAVASSEQITSWDGVAALEAMSADD